MRLPFFSSSAAAHDAVPKDGKKKKKRSKVDKGKALMLAVSASSPTTVLSIEPAGWASSPSAGSGPSPSSSSADHDHSVSSMAAAAPPVSAARQSLRGASGGVTKEDLAVVLRHLEEAVSDDAITAEADVLTVTMSDEELAALLAQMPREDELLEVFRVFDANGDGRITAEELRGALMMLGDDGCSVDDCRDMILGVDSVGDGFVRFPDFARMMLAAAVDLQY